MIYNSWNLLQSHLFCFYTLFIKGKGPWKDTPGFYEEKRKTVPGFARLCHDLESFAGKIGDPITDPVLNRRARKLDQQTAAEFLESYGDVTKAVLEPYCRAAFCAGLNHISAAAMFCFFAFEEADKYTIESGGYGLASILRNHLNRLNPGHIVTEAPVSRIQNQSNGLVEVSGSTFRVFAKAVIVTTPLVHAKEIVANLSVAKTAMINNMRKLPYLVHNIGPLNKDLMKAYTIWTPESPFPAIVNNTWGIKGATDHSIRVSDPLELSARLNKKSVQERQREVFEDLCELFPEIRGMKHITVQTRVYHHPFPLMIPKFLSEAVPYLRMPERDGQIVLAGQLIPCIESAFNEGERGARHVLENMCPEF